SGSAVSRLPPPVPRTRQPGSSAARARHIPADFSRWALQVTSASGDRADLPRDWYLTYTRKIDDRNSIPLPAWDIGSACIRRHVLIGHDRAADQTRSTAAYR